MHVHPFGQIGQLVDIDDRLAVPLCSDPLGVDVECRHNVEVVPLEARVPQQSPAQAPRTHQERIGRVVPAQEVFHRRDERADRVTDPRPADDARIGEVLAHLGGVQVQGFGDVRT